MLFCLFVLLRPAPVSSFALLDCCVRLESLSRPSGGPPAPRLAVGNYADDYSPPARLLLRTEQLKPLRGGFAEGLLEALKFFRLEQVRPAEWLSRKLFLRPPGQPV